jgi:Domain of unknown function (DUF4383)
MPSHIPINHRLQPIYRFLAALAGAYVLAFGIVGVIRTAGKPFFDQVNATEVLGLRTNLAFAILSIVAGVVVLGGALIGRNVDHFINIVAGIVFLVAGMLMMTLLQTNADFLNFQMATCIVSFVIGIVLFTSGLYGRTGTNAEHLREEHFRAHVTDDPHEHRWTFHGAPPRPVENDPDVHRFA